MTVNVDVLHSLPNKHSFPDGFIQQKSVSSTKCGRRLDDDILSSELSPQNDTKDAYKECPHYIKNRTLHVMVHIRLQLHNPHVHITVHIVSFITDNCS